MNPTVLSFLAMGAVVVPLVLMGLGYLFLAREQGEDEK